MQLYSVPQMQEAAEQRRAVRRAEILAAACRCFARDGFHATSMAEIIEEAGLSAGAVYRYFRSKDDLIASVVEMTIGTADELFAQLLADDPVPSPDATITFLIDAVLERAVNNPVTGVDMSRLALNAWAEALRDRDVANHIEQTLTLIREHYAEVVRRWQAAGELDPSADPTHVGAVLMGIVHAFAIQRLLLPGTDPDQYVAGVRALLESAARPSA
jgi:AcrR family transcriptional regulator